MAMVRMISIFIAAVAIMTLFGGLYVSVMPVLSQHAFPGEHASRGHETIGNPAPIPNEMNGVPGHHATTSPVQSITRILAQCKPQTGCLCSAPAEEFVCSMQCAEDEPALVEGFSPWTMGVELPSSSYVELCRKGQKWFRFYVATIVDGTVLWKACGDADEERTDEDLQFVDELLRRLMGLTVLPNLQFAIFLGDEPGMTKIYHSPIPTFSWTRAEGFWEMPFPSQMHTSFFKLKSAYKAVPWEKKIDKAYFRGSLSSQANTLPASIATLPRIKLLRISKRHPQLFDVGVTGIDHDNRAVVAPMMALLKDLGMLQVPSDNFAETLPKYKYLLNIDGVLASFRMGAMLGAGSTVLMQQSYSQEFFVSRLVPWHHYVPVRGDLSDLVEKIMLLKANETLARNIAEAGRTFAMKHLRQADMYCYTWRALTTLGALQAGYSASLNRQELERAGFHTLDRGESAGGRLQCPCCPRSKSTANLRGYCIGDDDLQQPTPRS